MAQVDERALGVYMLMWPAAIVAMLWSPESGSQPQWPSGVSVSFVVRSETQRLTYGKGLPGLVPFGGNASEDDLAEVLIAQVSIHHDCRVMSEKVSY